MATVRIDQRSKKSLSIVIDRGIDPITKKRNREVRSLNTLDMKEAEVERLRIMAELAEGAYRPTSKMTVAQYFEYWFTTPAAKKLDIQTVEHYRTLYELRIKPWLGNIRLANLTRDDLYSFYSMMIETGRIQGKNKFKHSRKSISKTTIAHYNSIIRRVLNHALYEDEIIKKNVATRLITPDPDPDAEFDPDEDFVKIFTKDELVTLEANLKEHRNGNLVAVALRTGMRREELLALTWDCIDFENGVITIKKALSYSKEKGLRIKTTKNRKIRRIEATPEVLSFFEKQSKLQAANKLRTGEKYHTDLNLVFCRKNGYLTFPNSITRWFPAFCKKIGISRLTFHCLRHTHASYLLSTGEDISYVSKRLGHSDISITYKTYFHLIPIEKRKTLVEFEKKIIKDQ